MISTSAQLYFVLCTDLTAGVIIPFSLLLVMHGTPFHKHSQGHGMPFRKHSQGMSIMTPCFLISWFLRFPPIPLGLFLNHL